MNRLVGWSAALYACLLFLYPRELRWSFGNEMMLAFMDDLEAARREEGAAGVVRVWWWALYELVTVALPGQQTNRYVVVPTLSFLMVALSQGTLILAGAHHARLESQIMPVLIMSLLAAMVAFLATCFCSRCPMTDLRLD